jgi:Na+/proline symporter
MPSPSAPDRVYPEFVWQHLPVGLAGLVMAAILAAGVSNLSGALNALSSTTVMDLYRPIAAQHEEAHYLRIARWFTITWGAILFTVGLIARHWGSVLEAGLTIASILYGSLLGVFLLGLLTKSVREPAAMTGMLAGLITMLYVRFATHIAFTWYVLIGTAATFATGWVTSGLLGDFSREKAAVSRQS